MTDFKTGPEGTHLEKVTFKEVELDTWPRKEHFEFFRAFDEPFFSVTAEVDCTKAREFARSKKESLFLLYLHKALKAANRIEHFRYRISGDRVLLYDRIDASPTIDRPDGTFGFSYMGFQEDFDQFNAGAQKEMDRVRAGKGLDPAVSGQNVIHFSAIPWIRFTSLSHARNFKFEDSCPKISFGKIFEKEGRYFMPVSVHVHHGLADGSQVGQFFELFQSLLNIEDYI